MGSARWHNCAELRAANGATILIRHGAAATEPFGLPSKLGDLVNPKRNGILTALCYRQPQVNHKMTKHTLTIFLLIHLRLTIAQRRENTVSFRVDQVAQFG